VGPFVCIQHGMTHHTDYQLGGNRDKAIDTYALANDWQEAFALALDGVNAPTSSDRFDVARIPALARSIADRLQATTRYAEAGRVLLDYAQDVEASVQALCEGALYREAIRIAHLYSQAGLLASVVQPSMDEAVMTHMEGMDEFGAQVRKQVARLEELAVLRAKDPGAFVRGKAAELTVAA
jgi:elongator complex protein 1